MDDAAEWGEVQDAGRRSLSRLLGSFEKWGSDRSAIGRRIGRWREFLNPNINYSINYVQDCLPITGTVAMAWEELWFFLFPAMWWRWSFHRKTSCARVREHDPMRKMQSVAGVTMVTLDPTLNHIPNPETFPRHMDWLKNGIDPQLSGWWFGTWIIFVHFIYGMSSFHWRTHIFQRGRYTTNQ